MRTFYAILACFALFVVYGVMCASLGWKNGGGLIPKIIVVLCVGAVWKAIRGGGAQSAGSAGTPVSWEDWQRQPDKDDKKEAL